MQIKKQHHYVWKNYLNSWTFNNKLPTYLKKKNKVINSNPKGVAQQRFFYSLEEFSENEEILLKSLVKKWSKKSTLKINLEFFDIFTTYSKIKRSSKNNKLKNNLEFNRYLKLIQANTMEDYHLLVENLGKKLINIRSFKDLYFLNNKMDLFFSLIFISFQYLRTKNMQLRLKDALNNIHFLSDKFLNFLPFIYATNIADSLTFDKQTKFIYLENISNENFITSDQPIINKSIDNINSFKVVEQFDIYYPITPRIAIIIHYKEQHEKFIKKTLKINEIKRFNKKIFDHSNEFVFANSTEQLEKYLS